MTNENEDIWEQLYLTSAIYNVGDTYPDREFDFYIRGISEKNVYCSNEGIKKQIEESLQLNPNRTKVVYFYYKRGNYV